MCIQSSSCFFRWLIFVSILGDGWVVTQYCIWIFLINGREHHHDVEAGVIPPFQKKKSDNFSHVSFLVQSSQVMPSVIHHIKRWGTTCVESLAGFRPSWQHAPCYWNPWYRSPTAQLRSATNPINLLKVYPHLNFIQVRSLPNFYCLDCVFSDGKHW
jgi:hypothetical protein